MASSASAPAPGQLISTGGWAFLITSAIGRLPASALQLGLLLYVTASGLGFATGGAVVAAVGVGTALGAPVVGRLVDRFGASVVVGVALVLQSIGLIGMHQFVASGSVVGLLVSAGLVGAANPQIGPIARARWSGLARERNQPDLVRAAMGYEGACDEASFVIGPVLASFLIGGLGPDVALWVLLALVWVGQGIFLIYLITNRQSWRPEIDLSLPEAAERFKLGQLAWPLLATVAVGVVFGATQTALAAEYSAAGTPWLTGLVYGCVGIGSGLASLLVVRIKWLPLAMRIAAGGAITAVAAVGLRLTEQAPMAAVLALFVGGGVGIVIVSALLRIEQVAPPERINLAMTLGATGVTLGVSLGAAVAGLLVTDPGRGLWPTILAGLAALLIGVLMRRPNLGLGRWAEPGLAS